MTDIINKSPAQLQEQKQFLARIEELKSVNRFSQLDCNFVTRASKSSYWERKPYDSIQDVFDHKTPAFSLIREYYGEMKVGLIIKLILEYPIYDFLSDNDKAILASHILSPYDELTGTGGWPGMTIQDFRVMMRMGVKGSFGKAYGQYKLSDVTGKDGWISQYFQLRNAIDEENHRIRRLRDRDVLPHKSASSSEEDIPIPDWLSKKIKKMEDDKLIDEAKLRKKKGKDRPIRFTSIWHYCQYNELDYEEFLRPFGESWREEYDESIPMDHYVKVKKKELLLQLNKEHERIS
jgi:hypothetical protein